VPIRLAVFSLIWISGVMALLMYSMVSYVKIKGKLQTATRVDGNVYETDAFGTAFVFGFIRPKIYVPANVGDADLSYILEHERTHIRRKDYLIKPFAFLFFGRPSGGNAKSGGIDRQIPGSRENRRFCISLLHSMGG
jgi:beta-lactamase regulating signal transducer with metallopeptidase domain